MQKTADAVRISDWSSDGCSSDLGQLSDGERGRLALNAERIRAGETYLGALRIDAEGTAERHQAELQLQGPLLDLALAFDGGLRGEDWFGRLTRGELSAQQQDWVDRRSTRLNSSH